MSTAIETPANENLALEVVHKKLEAVRDTRTIIDEFILDAIRFSEASESTVREAENTAVDSEAALQVSDVVQTQLKQDMKAWDNRRLSLTRKLDDLKSAITDPLKPGIVNLEKAVRIRQSKMTAFRRALEERAEAARREAERDLREQKLKELEAAARLEEKAARLKTEKAKQRALAEAEEIRQTASIMPESVALSASIPDTVASDQRDNWKSKVREGRLRDAFLWLADHPEWWSMVVFKDAEQKRFAKQFHNAPNRPDCFEFWNDIIYASKRQ